MRVFFRSSNTKSLAIIMANDSDDDAVPTRDPFTPTRPAYLPLDTTADPQDSEQPVMPFPPALQQQALAGQPLLKAMITPYTQMSTEMHEAQSTFRYAAEAQEQGWKLSGVGHHAVDHTTEWEEPYVIQYGISVLGLGLETALDAVQVDDRHMYWTKVTHTHSRDAGGCAFRATGKSALCWLGSTKLASSNTSTASSLAAFQRYLLTLVIRC